MSIATGLAATALFFATALPFTASAGTLTTLYTFKDKADGIYPVGPMAYVAGSLYGTTIGNFGDPSGYGNVFKVKLKTGRFEVVHAFQSGLDGADPYGGVIYNNGLLYGTTRRGGGDGCEDASCGTIFSIDPKSNVETILYTAPLGASWIFNQLMYLAGSVYGSTLNGGAAGQGSVFSLNLTTNSFSTLHSFGGDGDGTSANPGLLNHSGLFYGTTEYGGGGTCYGGGCGIVFSIDPATNVETILHLFKSKKDGAFPLSNLIYYGGNFFGATAAGGSKACKHGCGVSFSINAASGAETILQINNSYSDSPLGLTLQNGNAYETLPSAGTGAGELVARNLKSGALTVLYTFKGQADGSQPEAPLLYHDGAFYGTTFLGGNGFGTVFKFVP